MEKRYEIISMIKAFLLSGIFILFFIHNISAQKNEINPKIKNESPLHLQSKDAPYRITDTDGSTYCHGLLDTCLDKLLEIGISKARLMQKVQCAVGDFDGNGYLDFAIWGIDTTRKYQYDIQWTDGKNYLVLFFEKSKIIRSIRIETTPGYCLDHYPPRMNIGLNGEPISKNDALWICGDTDGYYDISKGTVYIFDSNLGNFRTIEFGKK
jgi:hypothetical protein